MPSCGGCDGEDDASSLWSVASILQYQKAGDLLIALAYFSIHLELFYFVTCSDIFPFRWIILQFGAFIVLCSLSHLATAFTYAPHSFLLFLTLTVLKLLTALVSLATAVSFVALIPQLLRLFVREGLLRQKARELDRDLGLMRRQEEAAWRVPMLTAEIRRSLDRNTILDTTLVQLSAALSLRECAIWMPTSPSSMSLTHQLHSGPRSVSTPASVSKVDADVIEIMSRNGVVILDPKSNLVRAAMASEAVGRVAATRVPLLKVSHFNDERMEASYAILILVLPDGEVREWTSHELETVEVVADQVAVALSHAAILEDSLLMREKLLEQNMVLNRARHDALLAREARESFKCFMTREIIGPIRSIGAIFSLLQVEKLSPRQLGMVTTGLTLSSLIADISGFEEGELELILQLFHVRAILEEAVAMSRLLCACRGVHFKFEVSGQVHRAVVGDTKRILQALWCMLGNVLDLGDCRTIFLQVMVVSRMQDDISISKYGVLQQGLGEDTVVLKFEVRRIGIKREDDNIAHSKHGLDIGDPRISFAICEKLARLMHGSFTVRPKAAYEESFQLLIRLPCPRSRDELLMTRYIDIESFPFKGMRVLLMDIDRSSIVITKLLLEKLGCHLTTVHSWCQGVHMMGSQFHLLLIDDKILENNKHEVASRIKQLSCKSWPLFVALTPNAGRKTKERCLQDGMHGVLCKPVVLKQMIDEVRRITRQLQIPHPLLMTQQN
ncbi:hypothetical protein BHM03_00008604 [Ensete ventricosum]|nr:hypothetical protein BHM03_00008604 [Ensete ventricosum]